MSDGPIEAQDSTLPPGTQLRLLYHHATRGAEYWNGVVVSNHEAPGPTGLAMRVRTHRTLRTCTNPARMFSEVELTLEELDSQIMPGWAVASSGAAISVPGRSPTVALPTSVATVPPDAHAPGDDSCSGTHLTVTQRALRASRRVEYLSGADRRRRDGQKSAAEAMQVALKRPRQGSPRHMLWLLTTGMVLGTTIVWDICSGPNKSMALAAEDSFEGVQALTVDSNPIFSADVTVRFEEWNPFGFMLAHYAVGDEVMLPYHYHFSPPCATFCVQTQGLHGRSAAQPAGAPDALPGAVFANNLVRAIVEFTRLARLIPGASPTVSVENPAGKLWDYIVSLGATWLVKHIVSYCRYGRRHRKSTHFMLSKCMSSFRGRVCVTASGSPLRGICGAVRFDSSGRLTHPGADGGASIKDALIPPLLCGDVLSSAMEYHHLARLTDPDSYNVALRADVERAEAQWLHWQASQRLGMQATGSASSSGPPQSPTASAPHDPQQLMASPLGATPAAAAASVEGGTSSVRSAVLSTKRRRTMTTCQACHQGCGPRLCGQRGLLVCQSCFDTQGSL